MRPQLAAQVGNVGVNRAVKSQGFAAKNFAEKCFARHDGARAAQERGEQVKFERR